VNRKCPWRGLHPVGVLPLILLGACPRESTPRGVLTELMEARPTSSQRVDPESFNKQLAVAQSEGHQWATDLIQITSRFINVETARHGVWTISGSGERPSRFQVTVVTDGIPDDSVRGKRYETTLERADNGGWRIREASMSWRCWRAKTTAFGVEACP